MSQPLSILDNIRIAAPCPASWADMKGDDRVRFCNSCKLNVYNISDMTRAEADNLIQMYKGRMCVTFFRRADGTVLTDNCPVGLRFLKRRFSRILSCFVAGIAFLITAVVALGVMRRGHEHPRLRDLQPFSAIADWLAPQPPTQFTGTLF